jgi:hypothetical protein
MGEFYMEKLSIETLRGENFQETFSMEEGLPA